MSAARAEILGRIGRVTRGAPAPTEAPRAYRRAGARSPTDRVELFCERVGEYRAEVRRLSGEEVAAVVADVCRERGAARIAVPSGVPREWRPEGLELVEDGDTFLSTRELDALDGVLTGCTLAVAETGTIALTGDAREGRRTLTLVPDLHVCVVEEAQVVELVPEAVTLLGVLVTRRRAHITLVSGPSATSDIELSRVEGVHGPRDLVVLVVS